MNPRPPPAWVENLTNWTVSTWPGRLLLGLIALAVVLPRLVTLIKYVGKVTLALLPLVLAYGSAFLLETPRTFDQAGSDCSHAVSAFPEASELGPNVNATSIAPIELRLKSSSPDLSWLERYWSVRCAVSQTLDDDGLIIWIEIVDFASGAQASHGVASSQGAFSPSPPAGTYFFVGPFAERDGTTTAQVRFAFGRLFARVTANVPGQGGDTAARARDMALAAAKVTYRNMPMTADLDPHRPFRDHLAMVWAAWLALLAVLPGLMTLGDKVRRELLLFQFLVLGLDVLRLTRVDERLGAKPEPSLPGRPLVARMRAARAARALSSPVSVVAWAAALILLLRWLPAHLPVSLTSAMLAGMYFLVEVLRMMALGNIPRFRYLRVSSWLEGVRRLAAHLVEAVYIGLVVYLASWLAMAWILTPIDTRGGDSPDAIVYIAYMWMFGPLAFWALSAVFRAASRRMQARDVAAALRLDGRAEVLYLRSFGDDSFNVPVRPSMYQSFGQLFDWSRRLRFEEVLVRRLWRYGPVLAVGRPGEGRSPLGAARMYYPDEAWQGAVQNLVRTSALVVVTMGKTPGLGWELETLRNLGALQKTVVIIPPTRDGPERASLLAELLGLKSRWVGYEGIRCPLVVRFKDEGTAEMVYGDVPDDVAYELALDTIVADVISISSDE